MIRALLLATIALLLGVAAAEFLATNFTFRRWLAQVVRHDELQALVGRRGIYQSDVERAWQAQLFLLGADPREIREQIAAAQKRAALKRLIGQEKLRAASAAESLPPGAIAHEFDLLRWQFRDDKTWIVGLREAGLSAGGLRREVVDHLRVRQWIEARIAPRLLPNDREARAWFEAHPQDFQEPARLRASHLFLAAPDGYPTEVIETKRALIKQLAARLRNGESFPALVAEFSEDEATKTRGGDLGYFAEERMLPPVFQAAQQLQPKETSGPVRSRLGFHLLRLTETRPARALRFEEAEAEINALLVNRKRETAVAALVAAVP
ncbi:MAG: peptidylprolyl isomerase [Spartobacteria bacterium]